MLAIMGYGDSLFIITRIQYHPCVFIKRSSFLGYFFTLYSICVGRGQSLVATGNVTLSRVLISFKWYRGLICGLHI